MKFDTSIVQARYESPLGPMIVAATDQRPGRRLVRRPAPSARQLGLAGASRNIRCCARRCRSWTNTSPARAPASTCRWTCRAAPPSSNRCGRRCSRSPAAGPPATAALSRRIGQAGGGARGRRGGGTQSAEHRRAVPPRAGRGRFAHRLCRRPGAQERVAAARRRIERCATGRPRLIDFVLLAAIWGASFLFMRLGAVEFGALPTAAVRVAVAAAVPAAAAVAARPGAAVAPALEARVRDRRAQFGHPLRVLLVRAAVDHHGPVRHPECHRAAVRRAGRLALAEGPADRLARARPGHRLRRRRAAGLGQGQLQAGRLGRGPGLGRAGLPACDALLRLRRQRDQALPERRAARWSPRPAASSARRWRWRCPRCGSGRRTCQACRRGCRSWRWACCAPALPTSCTSA